MERIQSDKNSFSLEFLKNKIRLDMEILHEIAKNESITVIYSLLDVLHRVITAIYQYFYFSGDFKNLRCNYGNLRGNYGHFTVITVIYTSLCMVFYTVIIVISYVFLTMVLVITVMYSVIVVIIS